MRAGEALLRYQVLMQRARSLDEDLARARERLSGDGEVERLGADLEAARAAHQAAALKVRELDREVATHRDRMRSHEREMMSGRIRNPGDLTRMSAEVDHMRSQLAEEEDTELQAMVAVDEAQAAVARLQVDLEAARGVAGNRKAEIEAAIPGLEKELGEIRNQADAVWQEVPADYRSAYARLSRLPNPVAEVAGGQCGACRVALTAAELQQVRRAERLVSCQSCSRILVAV